MCVPLQGTCSPTLTSIVSIIKQTGRKQRTCSPQALLLPLSNNVGMVSPGVVLISILVIYVVAHYSLWSENEVVQDDYMV